VSKSSSNVKVSTLPIDLANLSSIPSVLKQLDALTANEDVEVIFFNAARIKPSPILEIPVEEIDEDFRVSLSIIL
jgi:short-subunit dehydrogenase